jgi:hypothetical protein
VSNVITYVTSTQTCDAAYVAYKEGARVDARITMAPITITSNGQLGTSTTALQRPFGCHRYDGRYTAPVCTEIRMRTETTDRIARVKGVK